MDIKEISEFLKSYDGDNISIMEVCGTHTAVINESGIPSLLSKKIKLISGPGCPVCVTVASYVDKLCELAAQPNTRVVTFGDMIRVPGSEHSLADMKSRGFKAEMVYTPFDIIPLAKSNPADNFIFAAVGFETTTPIYALLAERLISENIKNVKLLTALKTMPAAVDAICASDSRIDGFIAPGNVCVIAGGNSFEKISLKYSVPFAVSGFSGKELLAAIYALVRMRGKSRILNLYSYAASDNGNLKAKALIDKYFEPCDAAWRGMGIIKNSGLALKDEYSFLDAGSRMLTEDSASTNGCICSDIIVGRKSPSQCPLYCKKCTPDTPQGACMVSAEGACFNSFNNSSIRR